jgi:protein PhnA
LEKLIQPFINLPKIKNTMDENDELIVRDSNGAVLKDGDSVTVIKDLKVRGSSSVIKRGTMVKNIRLTDDAEEVEGKVEKSMMVLRTEFLKKA